eukprot:gnl/TRDRNA2_/TRDRNA2_189291_c0_seq1.p1 gnl/TRDRNA2_/TRDRNA2_189291_c0~~gnl/TRDRNA2_/TRDRNA2_189291_c0_seq1.p1  ORF type:complete len:677 (+),score=94.59 gnl/TRDRNA2_/TRDRNA2_189291_c0_seq1:163-2193(+)
MGGGASHIPGGFKLVRTLSDREPDRFAKHHRYDKYREIPPVLPPIWDLSISESWRVVAAAVADNTVHLWGLESHPEGPFELIASLTAHKDTVWAVEFSPNELVFATASGDSTIRIWQTATGNPISVLRGHQQGVRALAFSPDGVLCSGGFEGYLALWECDNIAPIQKWLAHEGSVHAIKYAKKDPQTLYSIGHDGSIAVWNGATAELRGRFPGGDGGGVICMDTHPTDRDIVAVGNEDGGIWIWAFRNGGAGVQDGFTGHHHLKGHRKAVWSVNWAEDGSLLASGSSDGIVRIWEFDKHAPMAKMPTLGSIFQAHESWVRTVAWRGKANGVVTGSVNGVLKIWNAPKKFRDRAAPPDEPVPMAGAAPAAANLSTDSPIAEEPSGAAEGEEVPRTSEEPSPPSAASNVAAKVKVPKLSEMKEMPGKLRASMPKARALLHVPGSHGGTPSASTPMTVTPAGVTPKMSPVSTPGPATPLRAPVNGWSKSNSLATTPAAAATPLGALSAVSAGPTPMASPFASSPALSFRGDPRTGTLATMNAESKGFTVPSRSPVRTPGGVTPNKAPTPSGIMTPQWPSSPSRRQQHQGHQELATPGQDIRDRLESTLGSSHFEGLTPTGATATPQQGITPQMPSTPAPGSTSATPHPSSPRHEAAENTENPIMTGFSPPMRGAAPESA